MGIWASGFNAHNQLGQASTTDLFSFTQISSEEDIELLFAGWSNTVIRDSNKLLYFGHRHLRPEPYLDHAVMHSQTPESENEVLHSFFGDENGLIGCLQGQEGRDGDLCLLQAVEGASEKQPTLQLKKNTVHTRYSTVARAGNGRIAAVQNSTVVVVFTDAETFKRNVPLDTHLLPVRRGCQLCAGATFFALLNDLGQVITWGDPRHSRCLARTVDAQSPADKPCLVEALDGIKVKKISSGGWMSAALSADGDVYIWGQKAPAPEGESVLLKELQTVNDTGEAVALVDFGSTVNFMDVAVGDGHILLLAEDRKLYAAGVGFNGQLGLGEDVLSNDDLNKGLVQLDLPPDTAIEGIKCGPLSSFLVVRKNKRPDR